MTNPVEQKLAQALWRIYKRPERPTAWAQCGNLPWNDPDFSRRMLREHLDESHGAASRTTAERTQQIDWLWKSLGLQPGMRLLDVTCGPGLYAVELARRGLTVTGIDFSPASIAYARQLAVDQGVAGRCTLIEQDVRAADFGVGEFDAAILLYGQLGVFPQPEAQTLAAKIARALKPGGRLAVELLDAERVDKKSSTWWYTDNSGLWGDAPFLHLGERFWEADQQLVIERFLALHLASGALDEIILCDQIYTIATMTALLQGAGFATIATYPGEWVVYVAQKG
jgi:SAM-dependent methyltransferase